MDNGLATKFRPWTICEQTPINIIPFIILTKCDAVISSIYAK